MALAVKGVVELQPSGKSGDHFTAGYIGHLRDLTNAREAMELVGKG